MDVIRHSKRLIASNRDLIKSTKNLIKTYPKRIEAEIKEREDFVERKKKAETELEDLQNDRITTEQNLANAKADLEHSRKVISDLKKNSSDNE